MEQSLTALLKQAQAGSEKAHLQVFESTYKELHRKARQIMAGAPKDRTLQPTMLINEAYLDLFGKNPVEPKDRRHFFSLAAAAMRRALIDYIREQRAAKRGGGYEIVEMFTKDGVPWDMNRDTDPLALSEVLDQLHEVASRQAKAVELRFFAGMTHEEIAEILEQGISTIRLDIRLGLAWLKKQLTVSSP